MKRRSIAVREGCLLVVLSIALHAPFAAASVVDAIAAHKHLGPDTCAGAQCHGDSQPARDSNIQKNEFSLWQEFDPHAKAFKTLRKPASIEIARKLGIGDPAQAKMCLDCHADAVPVAQRGKDFDISQGVGCEACHGGAEGWFESHRQPNTPHAQNLANGMYPTDQPLARAQLCLSCHMGTRDRMITHRIMGAGHPRLSFELDTFTFLNPHYQIGEAWTRRKGEWNGVRDWAVGQGVAASNLLDVLTDDKAGWQGIFPELVLFDCHACHKPMSGKRWGPRQGTGLGPGVVRLNDANLTMFRHVLAPVDKAAAARVLEQTRALHQASTQSREAMLAAARRLDATLKELLPRVAAFNYTPASFDVILASMQADVQRGEFRDYAAAEQAAMAAQACVNAFEKDGKIGPDQVRVLRARLDALNDTLTNEDGYSMQRFNSAFSALRAAAP